MLSLTCRSFKAPPRVTPEDGQADALRRKRAALNYTPENGFHKDRKQDRVLPARWQKLA